MIMKVQRPAKRQFVTKVVRILNKFYFINKKIIFSIFTKESVNMKILIKRALNGYALKNKVNHIK